MRWLIIYEAAAKFIWIGIAAWIVFSSTSFEEKVTGLLFLIFLQVLRLPILGDR